MSRLGSIRPLPWPLLDERSASVRYSCPLYSTGIYIYTYINDKVVFLSFAPPTQMIAAAGSLLNLSGQGGATATASWGGLIHNLTKGSLGFTLPVALILYIRPTRR